MMSTFRSASLLFTLFLVTATLTSWRLYGELLRGDCGLQDTQARSIVTEDLLARGMTRGRLEPAGSGRCRLDYRYVEGEATVDYAVLGDWRGEVRMARSDGRR